MLTPRSENVSVFWAPRARARAAAAAAAAAAARSPARRSIALRAVWECARGWCLRGVRFPRRALASAAAAARARRAIGRAFSAFVCGLRAVPPPLGVRCALFSVFVGVGRFSGVNKIGRLFGGASPSGFAFGLRLRASPSGPPEATTRLNTHGRCPGSFPDSPQNTHGTPRSYLPRNTALRRFGALPVALAVLHLMEP